MSKEVVRVFRLIEYVGPRDWVEATVAKSIHGEHACGQGMIRGITVSMFPEAVHTQGVKDETGQVEAGNKPWGIVEGQASADPAIERPACLERPER